MDNLIDLAAGKEDDLSRIVSNRVVFHLLHKVRQYPHRRKEALIHVLQRVRGGKIELLILREPGPLLLHQIDQQVSHLLPLPRGFTWVEPLNLFFRQHPVHGNVPQNAADLPSINLFACSHRLFTSIKHISAV